MNHPGENRRCRIVANTNNGLGHDASGGFRGDKGQIHEGGNRIPFIIRWTGGGMPAGSTYDHHTGVQDLDATLAEIAGSNAPVGSATGSISFKPQLMDGSEARHHDNLLIQSHSNYFFTIRKGPLKLIFNPDGTPNQLYDLEPIRSRRTISSMIPVITSVYSSCRMSSPQSAPPDSFFPDTHR